MLEVKPITNRDTFVQPVQAASAVAKDAHHQVSPATMVTISAAAAALSTNNKPKAAKDQGKEDPRTSFRKKSMRILRAFIPWRKDFYSKFKVLPKNAKLHPTDKTLQWEMMLGKAIIKWAHEQGYRGQKPLSTVTFTPKTKRVRPAFELAEYRQLWRAMHGRILRASHPRIRSSRELLRS